MSLTELELEYLIDGEEAGLSCLSAVHLFERALRKGQAESLECPLSFITFGAMSKRVAAQYLAEHYAEERKALEESKL